MSDQLDNLIMAGGTGGHIFPGLALARELQARGESVAWLGSRNSMEARQIPATGIDFYALSISGLRGKGKLALLLAPLRLLWALLQAWRLLRRLRPARVIGFGGFASGPGGLAAYWLGIPLYIHEQNALPGMTNRRLSQVAQRVFTAFPSAFADLDKVVCVGNPVRADLCQLAEPQQRYQERSGPLRVLVVGGSLGAQVLNERLPQALASLPPELRPQVWHQAGAGKEASTLQAYQELLGDSMNGVQVSAFIEEMASAYAWADLVICRAGALTISELAVVGVAAVLVPFPFAVDDHQTYNARFLAESGAAILLPQPELTVEGLAELVCDHPGYRQELAKRAAAARQLARPQATADLALALLKDE